MSIQATSSRASVGADRRTNDTDKTFARDTANELLSVDGAVHNAIIEYMAKQAFTEARKKPILADLGLAAAGEIGKAIQGFVLTELSRYTEEALASNPTFYANGIKEQTRATNVNDFGVFNLILRLEQALRG